MWFWWHWVASIVGHQKILDIWYDSMCHQLHYLYICRFFLVGCIENQQVIHTPRHFRRANDCPTNCLMAYLHPKPYAHGKGQVSPSFDTATFSRELTMQCAQTKWLHPTKPATPLWKTESTTKVVDEPSTYKWALMLLFSVACYKSMLVGTSSSPHKHLNCPWEL